MSPFGKTLCAVLPALLAAPHASGQGDPFCAGHPGAPRLVFGNATCLYDSATGDTTVSLDSSSVIYWNRFKVGRGSRLAFRSGHPVVNRLNSDSQATVDGHLTAEGHLVLLNPQGGIRVGSSGVVEAPSFTASALASQSDLDFLDPTGPIDLPPGDGNGIVTVSGTVRAGAGDVAIAGTHFANDGRIEAPHGSVHIGLGDALVYDPDSKDRRFNLTAPSPSTATNLGIISGADVELTAGGNITNGGILAAAAPRGRVFLLVDPETGTIDLEPSGTVTGALVTAVDAGTGTRFDPSDGSNRTTRTSSVTRFPKLRSPGSSTVAPSKVIVTRTAVAALSTTNTPPKRSSDRRRTSPDRAKSSPLIASRGNAVAPTKKPLLRRSSFFGVRTTDRKEPR